MSAEQQEPVSITLTFVGPDGADLIMGLVEPGSRPVRVQTAEGVVERRPRELRAGDLVQVAGGAFRPVESIQRSDEARTPGPKE